MYFAYCIILKRPAEEFWEARPSKVIYCIERFNSMLKGENTGEVEEITSMSQIPGWGTIV